MRGLFASIRTRMERRVASQPTFFLSRWVFLRLLGVVYLIAFLSLRGQILGLVGSRGIVSIAGVLERFREGGSRSWTEFPTLCWFSTSDGTLESLCNAGVILSVVLILGYAQVVVLAMLWVLYLSLAVAGLMFLSFQWDVLLLETGLLAILFAPVRLRPRLRREDRPSPAMLAMLRWLLFRFMFLSGVVKLTSGDETWWGLTSLDFHYQTQPLPTWTAWYAHQLPSWFDKVSVAVMFGIEVGLPFLIFGPRPLRMLACFGLVTFQVLIAATGNYCFFNLLAIVLCVPLLDDRFWARFVPRRRREARTTRSGSVEPIWKRGLIGLLFCVVLPVSLLRDASQLVGHDTLPELGQRVLSWSAPFRSINGYGLFRVMTTRRPEIIVEGSNDGREWKAYKFRWKPGDVKRRPRFVAPHQPRLDWQMWFAALGSARQNPWFVQFAARLLEGAPPVIALLEENPFPDKPPRYVRAVVYEYHFTSRDERQETGAWWKRDLLGLYLRPISLR